jgi:hypothetical protein
VVSTQAWLAGVIRAIFSERFLESRRNSETRPAGVMEKYCSRNLLVPWDLVFDMRGDSRPGRITSMAARVPRCVVCVGRIVFHCIARVGGFDCQEKWMEVFSIHARGFRHVSRILCIRLPCGHPVPARNVRSAQSRS